MEHIGRNLLAVYGLEYSSTEGRGNRDISLLGKNAAPLQLHPLLLSMSLVLLYFPSLNAALVQPG